MKNQHRNARKDSKVKAFVLYSLRHTMLTRLGESGAEAFTIQKIAGHSNAVISQSTCSLRQRCLKAHSRRFEAYKAAELAKETVQ